STIDVLDATSGTLLATTSAGPIPAIGRQDWFVLYNGTLSAIDLTSNGTVWTFTGDGALTSAPVVVNDIVFVGSASGNLYALDALASVPQILWQGEVGAAIPAPDEQDLSLPLTGLGAGNGVLVVPAGSRLVAYAASATTPTPTATLAASR